MLSGNMTRIIQEDRGAAEKTQIPCFGKTKIANRKDFLINSAWIFV